MFLSEKLSWRDPMGLASFMDEEDAYFLCPLLGPGRTES